MNANPVNSLEPYRNIVGEETLDQLYQLANPLKQIKIVHVNSTALGGGVAEILTKLVPLTCGLGIETHWEVIQGDLEFFECTKAMHNGIQGNKVFLSPSILKHYESINEANAERLKPILEDADIVFIHDPQPLPLLKFIPKRKGKWIWRCHIDASRPSRSLWQYLHPYIESYDAVIFSLAEFAHPLSKPMFVVPPSIDPLSDKNIELDEIEIQSVHHMFGIDPSRPKILQVSRFDRFKDPLGVVESYKLTKKFNPSVQLILAGSTATDDPEGEKIYQEVKSAAGDDQDIHLLMLPADAHRVINALQRTSTILVQKSIREGFGLTVTEGLWKSKPMIGGNTGGIRLQVINNQTGFVVNTPEGAAYRMRYLLQHPEEGIAMGIKGKEYVRQKFLITRHLKEYLSLIYSLLFANSDRIEITTLPN